jgi:hypothetical protein
MRVKTIFRPAAIIAATLAIAGASLASPTPVAPTRGPVTLPPSAVSAPSPSAPGTSTSGLIYTSVTPDQIAALLHAKGYKAEIHTLPNVGPVIASATDGANYVIFFYGCTAGPAPACKAIQFLAFWSNTSGFTADDANRCNDKTVFGKLVGFPDKVILSHPAAMEGASDRFLEVQLSIWDGVITATRQCFAQTKPIEPPAKGGATPHAANPPSLIPNAPGQAPASLATSAIPLITYNPMPR